MLPGSSVPFAGQENLRKVTHHPARVRHPRVKLRRNQQAKQGRILQIPIIMRLAAANQQDITRAKGMGAAVHHMHGLSAQHKNHFVEFMVMWQTGNRVIPAEQRYRQSRMLKIIGRSKLDGHRRFSDETLIYSFSRNNASAS